MNNGFYELRDDRNGFTLVEISIVLVIIALLVGGVLIGRSLIEAATIRSQVSQLEKFSAATNAFKAKYNGLPGDLSTFASFGFVTTDRGGQEGNSDGNGVIEGDYLNFSGFDGYARFMLESQLFWRDLQDAGLIQEGIVTSSANLITAGSAAAGYLPKSKLRQDIFVHIDNVDGINHYVLTQIDQLFFSYVRARHGLTPFEAYSIDAKLDDGVPDIGSVASVDLSSGSLLLDVGNGAATPIAGNCYATGTPSRYALDNDIGNAPGCTIRIKAGF